MCSSLSEMQSALTEFEVHVRSESALPPCLHSKCIVLPSFIACPVNQVFWLLLKEQFCRPCTVIKKQYMI